MKKRVYFAGFSESEIRALQPAFDQISDLWACEFSSNGLTVISKMANEPFVAVVADLSTDSQSGAEILQQVANSHPRVLRFALGDVKDREMVANAIGGLYQFLSRPWKPPQLIAIIERSLAFDSWLSNNQVRDFVPQLGRLPCLTSTYFEILRKTESADASIESVAEIVARDPTLTARLLQIVNSAANGIVDRISSPTEAVAVLGLETVKSLVLCLQVFEAPASGEPPSISLDELWRRSFGVAQLARQIALLQTQDSRMASDAFTAGLLHRIGQIVLATNLSKKYAPVVQAARSQSRCLHEEESDRLGVTSNQIGAYLLGLWGMPLPIVEAAAFYLTPSTATTPEFSLLTAVHVADVLASEDNVLCKGLPKPKLDRAYLAKLGLPEKSEAWRKLLANSQESLSQADLQTDRVYGSSIPQGLLPPKRRTSLVFKGVMALAAIGIAAAIGITKCYLAPSVPRPPATAPVEQTDATLRNRESGLGLITPPAGIDQRKTLLPSVSSQSGASDFDSINVQGIFFRADRAAVVINGQTLLAGQQINGATVVSIQPSSVLLESQGEQREFKIK